MTDPELNRLVEAWKMTVQVQQHFNDIELRIRGLAITVLAAVVAAAAVAVENGKGHLGAVILGMGLVAWLLFLFVDQAWYHRLLLGAVAHGKVVEGVLGANFALATAIANASPIDIARKAPYLKRFLGDDGKLHSTGKISVFYGGVAILIGVAAIATWSVLPDTTPARTQSGVTQHSPTPSGHH